MMIAFFICVFVTFETVLGIARFKDTASWAVAGDDYSQCLDDCGCGAVPWASKWGAIEDISSVCGSPTSPEVACAFGCACSPAFVTGAGRNQSWGSYPLSTDSVGASGVLGTFYLVERAVRCEQYCDVWEDSSSANQPVGYPYSFTQRMYYSMSATGYNSFVIQRNEKYVKSMYYSHVSNDESYYWQPISKSPIITTISSHDQFDYDACLSGCESMGYCIGTGCTFCNDVGTESCTGGEIYGTRASDGTMQSSSMLDFDCVCNYGYGGTLCTQDVDLCTPELNPCGKNSTCWDRALKGNDVVCLCSEEDGVTGEFCDIDIDDCVSSPCDTEVSVCVDDGIVPHTYTCVCLSGLTGGWCGRDIDDCLDNPCKHGTCSDDGSVRNSFNCSCEIGSTGELCDEDVDDCASNPCMNEGTCSDDGSIPNAFNCSCPSGLEGKLCETDVDDCTSNPCRNGTCSDDGSIVQSFNCTCDAGFNGTLCDIELDKCMSSPCQNGGTCIGNTAANNSISCTCPEGFVGALCEDIDSCVSSPCNSGTCVDLGTALFECLCDLEYYEGTFCEIAVVDACISIPCANEAVCTGLGGGNFACDCVAGSNTTGAFCEVTLAPARGWVEIHLNVPGTDVDEASVLQTILGIVPDSVAEQYSIMVSSVGVVDGVVQTQLVLTIASTDDAAAEEIVDVLMDDAQNDQWTVVVVSSSSDSESNIAEGETTVSEPPNYVLWGLIVGFSLIGLLLCMVNCFKCGLGPKMKFVSQNKTEYALPT